MSTSGVHICPRCESVDTRHYLSANAPTDKTKQAAGRPDENADLEFTCVECGAQWYVPLFLCDTQYKHDWPAVELHGEDLARDARLARVVLLAAINKMPDEQREQLNNRLPYTALFIVDDLLAALAEAARTEQPHA